MEVHTDPATGRPYLVDPATGEGRWVSEPPAGATLTLPSPAPDGLRLAVRPDPASPAPSPYASPAVERTAALPPPGYPVPHSPAPGHPVPHSLVPGHPVPHSLVPGHPVPHSPVPAGQGAYGGAPLPARYASLNQASAQRPAPGLARLVPASPGARAAMVAGGGALAVLVVLAVALTGPEPKQPVQVVTVDGATTSAVPVPSGGPASGVVTPARSKRPAAARSTAPAPTPAPTPADATSAPPTTRRAAPSRRPAPTPTSDPTGTPTSGAPFPTPTAGPQLQVVVLGRACLPIDAPGVTADGRPAVCSATNGNGQPNPGSRALWRLA